MSRHQYRSLKTVISHRFEIRSIPALYFLLVKTADIREKLTLRTGSLELVDTTPSVILEGCYTLLEEQATVRE